MLSGYDPTTSSRGGAEISFYTLAKALVSLGIEVHLITEPPSCNLKNEELVDGIYFHRILNGLHKLIFCEGGVLSVTLSSKSVADAIVDLQKTENFDLVHACNRNTSTGAVIASKRLKIPGILHVRDYWPFCPTVALQRYYTDTKCGKLSLHCTYCHFHDFKDVYGNVTTLPWAIYANFQTMMRNWYAKKASRLIAISEFVKGTLIRNGFNAEQISVVYNPVKCVASQNSIYQPRDKTVILFVGTLSAYKGIFDVIEAVKIVHSIKANLELRIIGEGAAEKTLRDWVRTNNIDYVKIMGKIPHYRMIDEYAMADIAVLPFRRPEPFGRVVVEAMCAGVPVISYATGAIPEIITHGKNGLLVELGNIGMLAKSIVLLLDDEESRKSIGEKAAEVARKNYDPMEIARKMILIYEDSLRRN